MSTPNRPRVAVATWTLPGTQDEAKSLIREAYAYAKSRGENPIEGARDMAQGIRQDSLEDRVPGDPRLVKVVVFFPR
jgi:hypothetical protein